MLFLSRTGLLLVTLGAALACELTPSDDILDGKACDSHSACSKGYSCDRRYNVCRKVGAPQCDDAGTCETASTPPLPGPTSGTAE
jgi:hypothetical protein